VWKKNKIKTFQFWILSCWLGQNNANLAKIDGKPKFEAAILIVFFCQGSMEAGMESIEAEKQ